MHGYLIQQWWYMCCWIFKLPVAITFPEDLPSCLRHVCSSYAKDLLLSFTSQRLANYKRAHTRAPPIIDDNTLSLFECPLRKSMAVANSLIFSAPPLHLEYINACNLPHLGPLCLTGFHSLELLPDIHRRCGVLKGNRRRALSQETKVTWHTTKKSLKGNRAVHFKRSQRGGLTNRTANNWCSSRLYMRPFCVEYNDT